MTFFVPGMGVCLSPTLCCPCPRGGSLVIPRAEMRKLRHEEVKGHAQDHAAGQGPVPEPSTLGRGGRRWADALQRNVPGETWWQEGTSTL